MIIELSRDLKARLLKSLKSGYIETNDYPELLSKHGQDFLALMQDSNVIDNDTHKQDEE